MPSKTLPVPTPAPPPDEADNTCECKTCRFFYGLDLPVAFSSSFDDLIVTVRATSLIIFKTWLQLHIIVKRFEPVIRKRWLKKSFQQRTAILSEAWPGIATTRRPDFAVVRRSCARRTKRADKEKSREAHLWPFINLESLLQPHILPTYISARSRSLPWEFVHADLTTAHAEDPQPNASVDKYCLRLHRRFTPRSYGHPILVDSLETESGCDDTLSVKLALHPYKAALVLEIQARILEFLHQCCHAILKDHDLSCLFSTPSTPPVRSSRPTAHGGTCAFTEIAHIAPYEAPRQMELGTILCILSSRTDEAADHIWALREDPGYFCHQLKTWAEHHPSMILDKSRQSHHCLDTTAFWCRVAADMISHAYTAHVLWQDATMLCMALGTLISNALTSSAHPLLGYAMKFWFRTFDAHMHAFLSWPLAEIARGFGASPPLRSGYVRPKNVCLPWMHELTRRSHLGREGEKRLDTLFSCLLRPEQHKIHGLPGIVEEIQRTLDVERDGDLITSWVANHFSDVALIVEITRQIDMSQPWVQIYRGGINDMTTLMKEEPYVSIQLDVEDLKDIISHCLLAFDMRPFVTLGYPCDKKPHEKSVTDMRKAESTLDTFWRRFDARMDEETLGQFKSHYTRPFAWASDRKPQRTPRWEKHPCFYKTAVSNEPARSCITVTPLTPVSSILSDLDPNARHARPSKAFMMTMTPARADKTKTRGSASSNTPKATTPSSSTKVPGDGVKSQVKLVFRLSKRAYKPFATIFNNHEGSPVVTDVCWHELLYAMGSLGFATEKLYGSSWQFTPPAGLPDMRDEVAKKASAKMQPIQSHEPHPSSKLRYWEAKRLGRRLQRHYGWTGQMFGTK